jgi:hypothetical protein
VATTAILYGTHMTTYFGITAQTVVSCTTYSKCTRLFGKLSMALPGYHAPKSPSRRTSPHHKEDPTPHNHPDNQPGSAAVRTPGANHPTHSDSSAHLAGRVATRKKNPICPPVFASCTEEARHAEVAHRTADRQLRTRFGAGRFAPCLARRRKGTRFAGRRRLRNGGHARSAPGRGRNRKGYACRPRLLPASFLLSRPVLGSLVPG